MSWRQGTVITITGEARDPVTKELTDPLDVQVTVWQPDGTVDSVLTYSGGGVVRLDFGTYQWVVDSMPAFGRWEYEVDYQGSNAVTERRYLRITPRRAAPSGPTSPPLPGGGPPLIT